MRLELKERDKTKLFFQNEASETESAILAPKLLNSADKIHAVKAFTAPPPRRERVRWEKPNYTRFSYWIY